MTLGYDGRRWDTWDNAVHYGITTLVLKICKNLLDARRLEHTFAPPAPSPPNTRSPPPVDNLWITLSGVYLPVDNLWITFTNVGNRLPTYRSYDTRKPLHDNVYDSLTNFNMRNQRYHSCG